MFPCGHIYTSKIHNQIVQEVKNTLLIVKEVIDLHKSLVSQQQTRSKLRYFSDPYPLIISVSFQFYRCLWREIIQLSLLWHILILVKKKRKTLNISMIICFHQYCSDGKKIIFYNKKFWWEKNSVSSNGVFW